MIVPLTLIDFLERAELVYGARVAVVDEPDPPGGGLGCVTYAQFASMARSLAAADSAAQGVWPYRNFQDHFRLTLGSTAISIMARARRAHEMRGSLRSRRDRGVRADGQERGRSVPV